MILESTVATLSTFNKFSAQKIAILARLPDADTNELAVDLPLLTASLMQNRTPDSRWPAPFNSVEFWEGSESITSFPRALIDLLIFKILSERVPIVFGLLRLIGVLSEEFIFIVPDNVIDAENIGYTRRAIDWSQLTSAISNPERIFETVYHWNNIGGKFDHSKLIHGIGALFGGLPSWGSSFT